MARHQIVNDAVTPRLFKNNLIEKLSHVHPAIPVIIYAPVISYFFYVGISSGALNFYQVILLFVSVVFFWTFTEYVIHRFAFHYEPTTSFGKYLIFLVHGIHHDYPRDPLRLVMPPVVSIPLAILFYWLFIRLMGSAITPAFFSGFVAGYLAYDMIHYATHHASLKDRKVWLWVKHHHIRHHYQDEHTGYGVSSPLWDIIFRTMPPKIERKTR